ncbi:RHS repeat-associated core domain-containing protein, partial [Xanthomonas arboricola]|uniref:RHS repeat-associated core domain-containing protein n=1 Tax=Xanthomonas arboricola TaxID=56448 RepID=UPI002155D160
TAQGGSRQRLLSGATYYPFGPSAGWTYGNGRTLARMYDQDYRPQSIQDSRTGGLEIGFGFDPVGDLTDLTPAGNPTPELQLTYDALGRLTALKDGSTGTVIDGYSYDGTGNRMSAKVGGVTQAYTYPTTNHRLSAVAGVARTYDKMGNTLTIGGKAREYLYDTTGRMTQVKRAGVAVMNYRYNGRGEQVRRYLGTTNTYTLYDEAGHWLGDYDTNGAPKQQAIWLDDLPVGLLANGGQLHYIEPDHLGSPRVVVDAARDVAVWNWSLKGEAFGNTAPNQDPDGDGTAMVFDMRFPGQRFDTASGFNQNYFRDYDAATGRYGQSDPIGLSGGIATYEYSSSSPILVSDSQGLQGRRAIPARPMTTQEIFARVEVPYLVRQIQNYEPTFRYQTVGPVGYRYNNQDASFLRDILRQHEQRQSQQCPERINYGSTPSGIPLSRHYSTERVDRNIPISLVDYIANNVPGRPERGAMNHYDPINDVTVIMGRNGVITSHRGE